MSDKHSQFDPRYAWLISQGTNSPWAYQEQYFAPAECELIISLGQRLASINATLGAERTVNTAIRRTTVSFFDPDSADTAWLFRRVERAVWQINQQFWNFGLHYLECLQFAQYHEPGDFYSAHMDMRTHPREQRKLGISVQLTADTDYQGNDLEFLNYGDNWSTAPRSQGSIVVFPSYQVHRVTALVSGCRHSLVAWAVGPSFK